MNHKINQSLLEQAYQNVFVLGRIYPILYLKTGKRKSGKGEKRQSHELKGAHRHSKQYILMTLSHGQLLMCIL